MQRLPGQGFDARFQFRVFDGLPFGRRSVNRIADHGIASFGKMHTNLMRPSGLDFNLQQGRDGVAFPHFPQREGVPAMPAFCGHFFAVFRMASHRQNNLAAFAPDVSPDQRDIFLVHVMLFKLRGQFTMRFVGFGGDDQTGGFLVQAVDNPRPQDAADAGKVFAVKKKRIDEGLIGIARSGVHHHARRFVDDDDGAVFVHNVQGNVLRYGGGLHHRLPMQIHPVACLEMLTRLRLPSIDQHVAFLNGILDLRA